MSRWPLGIRLLLAAWAVAVLVLAGVVVHQLVTREPDLLDLPAP